MAMAERAPMIPATTEELPVLGNGPVIAGDGMGVVAIVGVGDGMSVGVAEAEAVGSGVGRITGVADGVAVGDGETEGSINLLPDA